MRVLVADDEPDVLDFLEQCVRDLGHEPLRAANGLAAWTLFETHPIHVVITDWRMPKVDGLGLVRRIREANRQRYTYVIMLTALVGSESYLAGMEAGADDFLTKPVSVEDLGIRLRVAERITTLHENVKLLEGLLAICMYCKGVRVAEDAWATIESYVEAHSDASFSHGVCPPCYERHVRPQLRDPGTAS